MEGGRQGRTVSKFAVSVGGWSANEVNVWGLEECLEGEMPAVAVPKFECIAVAKGDECFVVGGAFHDFCEFCESFCNAVGEEFLEVYEWAFASCFKERALLVGLFWELGNVCGVELNASVVPCGAERDDVVAVFFAQPVAEGVSVCGASVEALVNGVEPFASFEVIPEESCSPGLLLYVFDECDE